MNINESDVVCNFHQIGENFKKKATRLPTLRFRQIVDLRIWRNCQHIYKYMS